jgi:hypothetical protein
MYVQTKSSAAVSQVYEQMMPYFPRCGRLWQMYAEHEMREGNRKRVEEIFSQALEQSISLDLWHEYLRYVQAGQRSNSTDHETLIRAYELALSKVGMDPGAGVLWVEFIKSVREYETKSSFNEGQKIELLRSTFQRAVASPIDNVEDLWRDYSAFETGVNKMLAQRILQEMQGKYNAARTAVRSRRVAVGSSIDRKLVCTPHTPEDRMREQVGACCASSCGLSLLNGLHSLIACVLLAREILCSHRARLSFGSVCWPGSCKILWRQGNLQRFIGAPSLSSIRQRLFFDFNLRYGLRRRGTTRIKTGWMMQ